MVQNRNGNIPKEGTEIFDRKEKKRNCSDLEPWASIFYSQLFYIFKIWRQQRPPRHKFSLIIDIRGGWNRKRPLVRVRKRSHLQAETWFEHREFPRFPFSNPGLGGHLSCVVAFPQTWSKQSLIVQVIFCSFEWWFAIVNVLYPKLCLVDVPTCFWTCSTFE